MSDTRLALLKARDPEFLDRLFRETNPYLLKMLGARKIYGNEAEELVCQTWHTFFEKLDAFEGRSEIRTYLGGILINKIREHRRFTERQISEEDPDTIMSNAFTPEGWWKQEPEDPQELLGHKQLGKLIDSCLQGLSPDQRDAFTLKEQEEKETSEICNLLGISSTNLGVLLFRAKEKLRKCMMGQLSEGLKA